MSQDPKVVSQFIAALDPSLLPTVAVGSAGAPAMTTEREQFVTLTSGTGITADVLQGVAQTDNIEANSLATVAFNYGFNESQWDRVRAFGDAADGVATGIAGRLVTLARNTAFNGTAYNRLRTASAANQSAANPPGALQVASVGNFGIQHTPAAAAQATISRAAGGAGVRHIATAITIAIAPVAAQAPLIFNLRDGASGVGAILWSVTLTAPAGVGQVVTISGLSIPGTANTAMTLESAAAPAATNFATVALSGYSVA